jgi:hypothetical protein
LREGGEKSAFPRHVPGIFLQCVFAELVSPCCFWPSASP